MDIGSATFIYAMGHFLTALFTIFIILGIGRLLLMLFWAFRERRKEKKETSVIDFHSLTKK